MKTVTAKEFRNNQTAIIKEVKAGQEYLLTSHRKPVAKLMPVKKTVVGQGPPRGSYAAVLESLKYTSPSTDLSDEPDYKTIRRLGHQKKYGR